MINTEYAPDRYVGNGSATTFAYNFRTLDANDLQVLIADANDENQATLIQGTDYTVTGVGEDDGGSITTLDLTAYTGSAVLPTGWRLAIALSMSAVQTTDLHRQGAFSQETHERMFDYVTQLFGIAKETLSRAVKVSITSGQTGGTLTDSIIEVSDTAAAAAQSALTSAASAGTSATAAAGSATAAGTSATAAADSATAAGTSASNAQAAYNNVVNTISSAISSATSDAQGYATDAQGYAAAAASSASQAAASASTLTVKYYATGASAGQTAFTHNLGVALGSPNLVDVYLNGSHLSPSAYTLTDANTLTLASGASAGDVVEIKAGTPLDAGGGAMTKAVYDPLDQGYVNRAAVSDACTGTAAFAATCTGNAATASELAGLAAAANGVFYGKNASGASGFITPTADDLPLLVPHVMPVVAQPTTGVALTKKVLNRLTATTAGTFYFPADLADGEWVAVRLAAGAGLHTLDCSNLSGVTLGLLDGTTTATAQTFAANEYNAQLLFRRDGNLIMKGA